MVDIIHKSSERGALNLGKIVGTIAWVTKDSLGGKPKLDKSGIVALERSLTELGISKDLAGGLAACPIIVGCNFGERKPACTKVTETTEEEEEEEEYSNENGSVIPLQASTSQARAERSATLKASQQMESTSDEGGE
jgi:hypothetical protein